jgi:hypothetical protein
MVAVLIHALPVTRSPMVASVAIGTPSRFQMGKRFPSVTMKGVNSADRRLIYSYILYLA